jgi:hypothetical protein
VLLLSANLVPNRQLESFGVDLDRFLLGFPCFFAPFSPGAAQPLPIDLTMRSVLFAGSTVAFARSSILFGS